MRRTITLLLLFLMPTIGYHAVVKNTGSITITQAPIDILPDSTAAIIVNFEKSNPSTMWLELELLDNNGNVYLTTKKKIKGRNGSQAFEVTIPSGMSAGSYKWHVILLKSNNKKHVIDEAVVDNVIIAPQIQNTVTFTSANTLFDAGTHQEINLDYTQNTGVAASVNLSLIDASGNSILNQSQVVEEESGSLTFTMSIPVDLEGTGFYWQAKLQNADQTETFLTLDSELVTITAPVNNALSFNSLSTTMDAGSTQEIVVDYTQNTGGSATLVLSLLNASQTGVLNQSLVAEQESGSLSFTVDIPDNLGGEGFYWQAQLQNADQSITLLTLDSDALTIEAMLENGLSFNNPPTVFGAGSEQEVVVNYTNSTGLPTYIQVRLLDANGIKILEKTATATETSDELTFTFDIPISLAGNDYSWHSQMFSNDWSTKLVNLNGPAVTIQAVATNTLSFVTPPTTLVAGATQEVSIDYTQITNDPVWIQVRLFDSDGIKVEEETLAGEELFGNLNFSFLIPENLSGEGFYWHAQMFNNDWSEKLVDLNGPQVTIELEAINSLTFNTLPSVVLSGTTKIIDLDYAQYTGEAVWVQLRLLNPQGVKVAEKTLAGSLSSGKLEFTLDIPEGLEGENYSWHAQMFSNDWSTKLVNLDGPAVTLTTTPTNSVSLNGAPTVVSSGSQKIINVNYVQFTEAPVNIQLRLLDANGVKVSEMTQIGEFDSGQEEFTFDFSEDLSDGEYQFHVQMFNQNWSEQLAQVYADVQIYTNDGSTNTLEFLSTPEGIKAGETYEVEIAYNVAQESILYVQVFNAEVAPWTKIGDVFKTNIQPGASITTLQIPITKGYPTASNRLEAVLFENLNGSWSSIDITVPFVNVPGIPGGTLFGVCPPDNESQNITCYQKGQGNGELEQNLGEGYWSNWHVSGSWQGPISASFNPYGEPSWVEWTNNYSGGSFQEFDIKIQKYSWHDQKSSDPYDHGYPTRIGAITKPLIATVNGVWAPDSKGRGHINITAWMYNGGLSDTRTDVIIHAWDNSGNLRQKYDDGISFINGQGLLITYSNIGEIESTNGLTYQVLRTSPGNIGELASYNLVPDEIVRPDPNVSHGNETVVAEIHVKELLDELIILESKYEGEQMPITSDWYLHGLEWTVTGQSGDIVDGVQIGNSSGRFTYNSFTIPDLIDPPSPDNVITFTDVPDTLTEGTDLEISVDYTVSQNSILYAQVFNAESAPWSKIGEGFNANVLAGTGATTIPITLNGSPSESNRLEVILFESVNGVWNSIPLITIPFVNIPGASGAVNLKFNSSSLDLFPTDELLNEQSNVVNELTVYPNPFINSFEYNYSQKNDNEVKVEIFTMAGQQVKSLKPASNGNANGFGNLVNASDLAPGWYLLKISSKDGVEVKKLLKN